MKSMFIKSAVVLSMAASVAMAGEFPIGDPIEANGMEIAAVYLQPIDMEPKGIDLAPSKADIHLEADIHAIEGNKNGFGAGEWIPYLKVGMPMVAQDGPHYGANVKMDTGVGNYEVKFTINNPEGQGFGRHADKESGVGKWFEPFVATYKFQWTGGPVK